MVVSDESKGGAPKKLSTKDILAAARAQAAQAAGGGAPAASPPIADVPVANAPAASASAATPATAAAETPAVKPATKPTPGKKPTSTADILAAARAQAAGGASAATPASEAAAPKATPAAKPAAAKPVGGGKPKSTADILAAARAAAAGGGAVPAAAEAGEKPAAKEKPATSTVAQTDAAATAEGPKLSVQEMLAAVRPGGAAPAADVPAAVAAKPAKPTVAPPMPAKPAPVKSIAGKSAAGKPVSAPAPDAGRRNIVVAGLLLPFALIGGLFSSAFAAAWTMLAATTGIATLATARFMLPNVLTEPPSKFKIGSPSDFDLGTVATRFVATNGVWIVHTDGYKGKNLIYALISVCTHLGCTPSWLEGERKFKCPCHGSGFYINGINFEGPAPRPLERAGIRLAEDGMLEVDKSVKFQEEMGQWNDPTSFFEVVA
jgi:cytochrome b6-f complex iron-sulfur subunit